MPPQVIDLIIVVLIAGMTYALMSEGLWGAALMFFNVMFAGLIAFNFYEYLAAQLAGTGYLTGFADTLCLMGIFIVALTLLRLTTETLAPAMVRFPTPVYHVGRFAFGLAASAMTIAILLVAFETAPVHKKVFGTIDYEAKPPFGLALDRKWLAFVQYTSGQVFASRGGGKPDPFGEYGDANVFDPRAEWLLNHQQARPYGTESVLEGGDSAGGAAPGGTAPGAPAAGGPAAAAGGGDRPGDPKVVGPAVGGGVVIPSN
jgi:uncharacterized membrane protein required for colicin V production